VSDELTLKESEEERIKLCVEIGQQVSEIWHLQAQRDALLAACKASEASFERWCEASLTLKVLGDGYGVSAEALQDAQELLQLAKHEQIEAQKLRLAAIAKAEGRDA